MSKFSLNFICQSDIDAFSEQIILRVNHVEWVVPYLIYHLTGRLVIVFKTEVQEFTLSKFSLLFFLLCFNFNGHYLHCADTTANALVEEVS